MVNTLDNLQICGILEDVILYNKIYCDMDQVLVNFLGGARKVLGREFNDPCLGSTEHEKWVILANNPTFWLDLEWMPGSKQIWDRIKDKDTYILSACPLSEENPLCPSQKKIWCQRELSLPEHRIFTVSRCEKSSFAMENGSPNLLIDDHPGNVQDWVVAGGCAIWHRTVPETLRELEIYFGL